VRNHADRSKHGTRITRPAFVHSFRQSFVFITVESHPRRPRTRANSISPSSIQAALRSSTTLVSPTYVAFDEPRPRVEPVQDVGPVRATSRSMEMWS
jgi:hypothetical protein